MQLRITSINVLDCGLTGNLVAQTRGYS